MIENCKMRPANGRACAEKFGVEYAKQHGKPPDWKEVRDHLTGNWSDQWMEVLEGTAYHAANQWLAWNSPDSLKHKADLEKSVQLTEKFFEPLDILLSVEMSSSCQGRWAIKAMVFFGKMKFECFRASSIEGILKKLSNHRDWAERYKTQLTES